MGHSCTIWIHAPARRAAPGDPAALRGEVVEWFAPVRAPVFVGFEHWHGADVALATGWETAHALALLPGCRARAYMVNDHEPEFFATSAEALWAQETYRLGFYPIAASAWLRDLVTARYGAEGSWFRLGVDHRTYWPDQVPRRDDTVIFYARAGTARRAVPLGMLALEELKVRRPATRVVMFGQVEPPRSTFAYENLGVASPGQLALNYCEATVGLCLSLTNFSLIPQEMMACGLPCVDVAGGSSESVFGSDGPLELAQADPVALADAMERLLGDHDRWRLRSEAGVEFVADANWYTATAQVERGLARGAARAGAHARRVTLRRRSAVARAGATGTRTRPWPPPTPRLSGVARPRPNPRQAPAAIVASGTMAVNA